MEVVPRRHPMKNSHLTWDDFVVHGVNRPSGHNSYSMFLHYVDVTPILTIPPLTIQYPPSPMFPTYYNTKESLLTSIVIISQSHNQTNISTFLHSLPPTIRQPSNTYLNNQTPHIHTPIGCKHSKVDQKSAPVYESHDFLGKTPISGSKMLFKID